MSTKIDIDKLLEDDPEENDDEMTEEEKAEAAKAAAGQGGDDDAQLTPEQLREKNKKLREQLQKRQEKETENKAKIRELRSALKEAGQKAPSNQEIEELKEMTPDQLREAAKTNPAAKMWVDLIDATVQKAVQPVKETAFRNAVSQFVAKHPDYSASPEGKAKFQKVVATAKANGLDNLHDEKAILDLLNRSFAFNNPDAAAKADPGESRARQFAVEQGSAPASVRTDDDDFTEEELSEAERMNMTPEAYRAAQSVYGSGNKIGMR